MKIDVIKLDGAKSGSVDLPDDIFGIEEIRGDILQRCVTWQLAKRRAGTHKIQTRNEVSRTGKKMAGHMGQDNVTTLNLTVFRVDMERGLILIKGAVPGTEGGFVKIRDAIKKAPPQGLPTPGAIKQTASAAAQVEEAPAAEVETGGDDQ